MERQISIMARSFMVSFLVLWFTFAAELAARFRAAGAFDPTFAAAGAAFVAFSVGLTVLFSKQDGRA